MRKHLNEFPGGIREALRQSVPFFVPAGVYYLEESAGQIVLDASMDMEGDGDSTEIRVRGKPLRGGRGFAKFAKFKMTGSVVTDYLLTYDGCPAGEYPGFEMSGINVPAMAGWVTSGNYEDTITRTIHQMTMRDCRGLRQRQPINLHDAVRWHSLKNITIEDFQRFAIIIGSGRRSGQLRMEGGELRHIAVVGGTVLPGTNNGGIWHGGRNVVMSTIHVENIPVPSGVSDIEGFYTKVDGLVVRDLTLIRAGGNQGLWGCKGTDPNDRPWDLYGKDVDAENLFIDGGGIGARTALWAQVMGTCSFRKVKVIRCAGVGFRMHATCKGDYELHEWDVWDHAVPIAPNNPGFVFRAGTGTLHVANCTLPTRDGLPWWREDPTGLIFSEVHNRKSV